MSKDIILLPLEAAIKYIGLERDQFLIHNLRPFIKMLLVNINKHQANLNNIQLMIKELKALDLIDISQLMAKIWKTYSLAAIFQQEESVMISSQDFINSPFQRAELMLIIWDLKFLNKPS